MAYRWPAGTAFKRMPLDVEDCWCPVGDRHMPVCDQRSQPLWTLEGPTQVVNRLVRCPDASCESRGRPFSPEAEWSLSLPRWCRGWAGLGWLGHRRFARHGSVPQRRLECKDTHQIRVSDDAIARDIGRDQTMLAARQQDPARLAAVSKDSAACVLTIDGLQPEKGHEPFSVVRELTRKRVWFAEPWRSSAAQEVPRVKVLARQWAERLAKPVRAWMSDTQEAFVQAIATAFPGIPHRSCPHHLVRDVAKPGLDMDRHATVTMRRTVRGLRAIARRVLAERRPAAAPESPPPPAPPTCAAPPHAALPAAATPAQAATPAPCASSAGGGLHTASALEATRWATAEALAIEDAAGEVVRGECAAVRGRLNESQGGPLHPPGVRMSAALQEVRDALDRNLGAKKGGRPSRC